MQFSESADSKTYFDLLNSVDPRGFHQENPVRSRLFALAVFFELFLFLPFGIFYKLYKTFFRALGLGWAAGLLLLTLGTSNSTREFFLRRIGSLAKDFGDWVLFPFAVLSCLGRLLLAAAFSPSLFFRF